MAALVGPSSARALRVEKGVLNDATPRPYRFQLDYHSSHNAAHTPHLVCHIPQFMQLSDCEGLRFQVELQILGTISPARCVWALGAWPGNIFQTYMRQSKRYFHDSQSSRNLVPAVLVKDQAWGLSELDTPIFMKEVSSDPSILGDQKRMVIMVEKAREQAASGKGLVAGVDNSVDTSPAAAVNTSPAAAVDASPASIISGDSGEPTDSLSSGQANDPPSSSGSIIQPNREIFAQNAFGLAQQRYISTPSLVPNIDRPRTLSCSSRAE